MLGPIPCLIFGIALVMFLILVVRLHAFLGLAGAAIIIALVSDRIPANEALGAVTTHFGNAMGGIGILIVLAAIIGACLMESGAADRIVRAFTRLFGKGRENYSLLSSGFVLSIPVFFDTVFYLLAPLARVTYARTKKDYVMLVCAIAAGGVITHALVPPTPGPLIAANELGYSITIAILIGLLAAVVPGIVGGVFYARWINKRIDFTPGDMLGVTPEEMEALAAKPDSELPSLLYSFLPIFLPIVLLASAGMADLYIKSVAVQPEEMAVETAAAVQGTDEIAEEAEAAPLSLGMRALTWLTIVRDKALVWLTIVGDKNVAFFLGALFAIWLVVRQQRINMTETMKKLEPAIASGAVIALITCAGGSFGKVLAASGAGEVFEQAVQEWGIGLLPLSFIAASLIRIAQGSTTTAMITVSPIVAAAVAGIDLPYHPVYLGLAIGLGGLGWSWMNDSGFWIFSKLTGLSETQTLKTWTVMLSLMVCAGFVWVVILSRVLPMKLEVPSPEAIQNVQEAAKLVVGG